MNSTRQFIGQPLSWTKRCLTWPATYVAISLAILLLDYVTGPYLLFPIFFVLPVTLSAWFYSAKFAYVLAVLLPLGRFPIAMFVDHPSPIVYIEANMLIRIAVLGFMAFLVARTARQSRALQERVQELVTMCAWSRTIEYQGEWISFEEYLKRRFDLDTSHGISPSEAEKALSIVKKTDRSP